MIRRNGIFASGLLLSALVSMTISPGLAASKYKGRVEESGSHGRLSRPAAAQVSPILPPQPLSIEWNADDLILKPEPPLNAGASAQEAVRPAAAMPITTPSPAPQAVKAAITAAGNQPTQSASVDYEAIEKAYAEAVPTAPAAAASTVTTSPPNPAAANAAINYANAYNYYNRAGNGSGAVQAVANNATGQFSAAMDVDNCACPTSPGLGQSMTIPRMPIQSSANVAAATPGRAAAVAAPVTIIGH